MKRKIKKNGQNRGLLGFLILLILIILFSIGQSVVRHLKVKEVKETIQSYICEEMDGQYRKSIIKADQKVGKVLAWEGNTVLRWNGIKARLVTSKSVLDVQYSSSEQQLTVEETFVLEKIEGKWKVTWHNVIKKDEEE